MEERVLKITPLYYSNPHKWLMKHLMSFREIDRITPGARQAIEGMDLTLNEVRLLLYTNNDTLVNAVMRNPNVSRRLKYWFFLKLKIYRRHHRWLRALIKDFDPARAARHLRYVVQRMYHDGAKISAISGMLTYYDDDVRNHLAIDPQITNAITIYKVIKDIRESLPNISPEEIRNTIKRLIDDDPVNAVESILHYLNWAKTGAVELLNMGIMDIICNTPLDIGRSTYSLDTIIQRAYNLYTKNLCQKKHLLKLISNLHVDESLTYIEAILVRICQDLIKRGDDDNPTKDS